MEEQNRQSSLQALHIAQEIFKIRAREGYPSVEFSTLGYPY